MFKENHRHEQMSFFNTVDHLPTGVKKLMDNTWAPVFRERIFKRINERRYTVLYSDVDSRPNFPVNVWVGLEIIKGMFDYTDAQLLEQFHFNLLTAYAVGQENLGELTLSERTIYYNRKRLLEYEAQAGRNLLAEEFEKITDEAMAQLGINPGTQRMDSSFVGSCIKQMSRLELAVKVLQNFYRDIGEEQSCWKPMVRDYVETEAGHIAYHLRNSEVDDHLQTVGALLFELHQAYAGDEDISALKSYQHISRILLEQFDISEDEGKTVIHVKPSKDISARSLQNPADDTATFRRKGGKNYQGDLFNVTETCDPENPVQLLTDVCVEQNVVSDESILEERLPSIKERTGVEEMITDAGYTGESPEDTCKEEGVRIVPTEVKGRKESPDRISLTDFKFDGNVIVSCPWGHSPIAQVDKPEKGRRVVRFDKTLCSACPLEGKCPAKCHKRFYSLSLSYRQIRLARRRQQLGKADYRRKCRLRPAIEGTVSQFKRKMRNGKLRVRGLGRVRISIIAMAIGVNFQRIWSYLAKEGQAVLASLAFFVGLLLFVPLIPDRKTEKSGVFL